VFEGVNIYKLINEQNWDTKKSEIAIRKLLREWERFLESGLLIKRGNRFFFE
jgi:oxygen-independent coproporphyrinogen-3 oxidase